ncbi:MAG: hypothetical protein N3D80_12200 [Ignavibacterium album]|uniref:hypothetical protein n=1 Tax=Ignavibacterium album TaxID=591197 RepID=UPI0026EED4A3|nr:hypothetical protein [Ignavibacterium album]MCX8106619.1 hypothetical protein [Ignavibacterium album]
MNRFLGYSLLPDFPRLKSWVKNLFSRCFLWKELRSLKRENREVGRTYCCVPELQ